MSKPLIAIVGISGSGKTSLVNKVSKKFNYTVLKSYTTRKPRENDEADLSSHEFCDLEDVAQIAEEDEIIASNWFDGNFYFCTKRQLDRSDLYVTDLNGLKDLYRHYFGKPIISIFLDVPPEIVAGRMERRGDRDEDIMRRLRHDSEVFKNADKFCDFKCENSNQDQCNDNCDFIDMLFRNYNGE